MLWRTPNQDMVRWFSFFVCFVLFFVFCFYLNFDLLVFLTLSFFFCGFENLILLTFTVLKPIFGYIGCCVLCVVCTRGKRSRIAVGKNIVSLVQHCQGSKLAHVWHGTSVAVVTRRCVHLHCWWDQSSAHWRCCKSKYNSIVRRCLTENWVGDVGVEASHGYEHGLMARCCGWKTDGTLQLSM